MAHTIDSVVAKYVQIRDQRKAISDRHAEELKPYGEAMAKLEQWLLAQLNATGQNSAATDSGTAYKSVVMSATIDGDGGWDALLGYIMGKAIEAACEVLENGGTPEQGAEAARRVQALALFNRAVNKTAVKEMMDAENGAIPPGVKIAQITNLNVKRA